MPLRPHALRRTLAAATLLILALVALGSLALRPETARGQVRGEQYRPAKSAERRCLRVSRKQGHKRARKRRSCPSLPATSQTSLFAPTSFWNAALADDQPLDQHSDRLVKEMRRIVDKVAAAHDGPWIASRQYSTPVYTVPRDQPRVRVKLDVQEASNMQGAFSSVPVPSNARPADGLDQHMTILQPSTDTLWEFWKFQRHADGWHARWGGGMHNVSTSPGDFDSSSWPGAKPWWGATGSSLPLLGGLITLDELRARKIDHALAFALPAIRKGFYSRPAQRTDGRDPRPDAIPMGARFRLDPRLDLAKLGLSPLALMVGQAIQRYGMVLRDTSSTIQFYAEDFHPSGQNPFPALVGPEYPNNYWRQLARLPWDRLEALPLDLHPQRS